MGTSHNTTFLHKTHRTVREDPPAPDQPGYNVFRNLVLHGLKDEGDFKVVFNGLSRLLNNLHRSRSAYIPSSATQVNTCASRWSRDFFGRGR